MEPIKSKNTRDNSSVRAARAEILHYAEPEDAIINWAIESFGPEKTADFLSGRVKLLRTSCDEITFPNLLDSEKTQLFQGLKDRINRWRRRAPQITSDQEFKAAHSIGAWLCIPEDDDWPQQLNDLGTARPYAIWCRGKRENLQLLSKNQSIAIVGSRETTSYGNSATTHLAGDLANNGYTIVSGGAFGIDAVAHRSALATSTSQLPTVALMACGVDRPYPKQNEALLLLGLPANRGHVVELPSG